MTVAEAVAVIGNAEQITLAESGYAFRLDVTSEVQMRAYGAFRVRKITAWDGEQKDKDKKVFELSLDMRPVVEEEGRARA